MAESLWIVHSVYWHANEQRADEDMTEKLKKLGLYAKGPEVVERVLVWPLSTLDTDATVRSYAGGGADLIVTSSGKTYEFNMRGKGHQHGGFASAEEFRDHINRLRPH